MGTYNLTIGYIINRTVTVQADNLEEAIEQYKKGNYQLISEEEEPNPSTLGVNGYFDEEDE